MRILFDPGSGCGKIRIRDVYPVTLIFTLISIVILAAFFLCQCKYAVTQKHSLFSWANFECAKKQLLSRLAPLASE